MGEAETGEESKAGRGEEERNTEVGNAETGRESREEGRNRTEVEKRELQEEESMQENRETTDGVTEQPDETEVESGGAESQKKVTWCENDSAKTKGSAKTKTNFYKTRP